MDSGSSEISKENAPDTQPSSDALDVDGLADERQIDTGAGTKLASELTSFFNAVDRVVTMMRVYPMGHPLLDGLIDNLHSRLSAILEREDAIFVNLDATELTTADGIPCFSEELAEKDEFIWYAPYSDGLLQLEFRRGLEADELRSLLRVINRAAVDAIFSDDDTVTLLWELQLDHIKYFAVEGFVDAGELEDFGERTEQEAVDLIADAAIEPNGPEAGELDVLFDNLNIAHLDLFTRMQVEANAKVIVPELRDQDLAYAFAVDESLVDRLCDEWMEGSELEYRLIEALLSVIRVAPGTAGASRAAEMIESLVLQLLESQSFQQAVRILELLHERRELFFDTEVDPLGELVTKLSDPMQIEALVNIFQRRPGERESITRLFLLLGRDNVLQQILGLLADDDRNVVALPQLVDIIFELVDESTETLITAPKYVEQSTYLRRLMSELPDRDFVDWKPTTRLIRRAIDDPDPEVRELGLMLDHPCWDDAGLAQNYLVPMADDADERIRKLALEQLGDRHPELFQEAIRDTILARKMGGRGHAELRFLMRVFLESSPDAPEYLRSLLDTKGWIGKGSREFAKMAAAILIESGDQAGIAKIQEACDSLFTSPELKRSYESSLRRFGGESSVTDATAVPVSEPSLDESSRAKPTPGGPLDPIPFDLDSEPEPASQTPQPSEPSEPDPDGLDDGISVPWWDESEEDA